MVRAPNPDTPAGRRILEVAGTLFYERGIGAVGVDLIADEAGTTKKTLYDRFGSKDALVAAYLRDREQRWERFLDEWFRTRAPTPGPERVVAVLDAEEAWWAGSRRGCAFVNAFAELGEEDHPGRAVLRAGKQRARAMFIALLTEAGVANAEALGAQVHLVYEGAMVNLTAGGMDSAFDEARAAIRALVG
ncbi:TetR/AcrR family transcriptional regulator [Saccharopolyspora halophila]|uniref:TetR/AcrR family transcriptional regulator n=1 Tax=Saccharopolyspora halophila TaxID=405551 RepID=A0ABN3G407_9PSEU